MAIVSVEWIEKRIYLIRGKKVMLSTDLANLYGVEVRALVQAVKRNIERFPEDFMFQINKEEFEILKSQIVISSWGGARRSRPYAFTEQRFKQIMEHSQKTYLNIEFELKKRIGNLSYLRLDFLQKICIIYII